MSWEFRRNLWIQLTPHRLIATPLVLGLAFLASAKTGMLTIAPETLFWLFAGIWGTRRAADSIIEEVVGGTWHGQRMAAIGAWSMTWGKLFGATAFAWYGAMLSWLMYAATTSLDLWTLPWVSLPSPGKLVSMLVFVLLAQAVSLLVALIQMRRRRRGRQLALGLAQAVGLLALLPFWIADADIPFIRASTVRWYGLPFPTQAFVLFSGALFFAWALAAVHQLMRAELQYRDVTWRLPLFALFLIAYFSGLVPAAYAATPLSPALLAVNGVAMLTLFYLALLSSPGEPIALLRWGRAVRQGHWRLVGELMPAWLPVSALVLAIGIAAMLRAASLDDWLQVTRPSPFDDQRVAIWIAALLVFAARDCQVVLLFAVGPRPERADINAVIWLAILHGLVPVVLLAVGNGIDAGMTSAIPGATTPVTLAAGVAQIVGLALLLTYRLGRLQPAAQINAH